MKPQAQRPTPAFIGASWLALFLGGIAYVTGLWNADLVLYEKGFYFVLLIFGLFASVSLQKSVRDRLEGVPVTGIYFGLCWVALAAAIVSLGIGLWNAAGFSNMEKGFYAIAYALSLFATVAIQKNVRDLAAFDEPDKVDEKSEFPDLMPL